MKKYIAIIILMVGFLGLQAQDLTISYQAVPNTDGTESLEVYMTNNTTFPIQIGAVNLSVMHNQSCAEILNVWSLFEQTWGQTMEARMFFSLNKEYKEEKFDIRYQYGNTNANVQAPVSVDLITGGQAELVMRIDYSKSCQAGMYIENLSENRANEITDLIGNSISYIVEELAGEENEIQLVDFQGFQSGESAITLEWVTQLEVGSYKFVVEKSTDAAIYESIGTVMASGNSDQPVSYDLVDQPVKSPVNYYRLKMIDIEGAYTYSQEIEVNMANQFDYLVQLFPNPTSNLLTLTSSNNVDKGYEIFVTDLMGKIMYKSQEFTLGVQQQTLDVSKFAAGTYIVELIEIESGKPMSRRFVKF